jgi:uncharacterized phiE125 gp8 family phage protein
MNSTLITAPTEEPVSLMEAGSHLRLDTNHEDFLITSLVKAARQLVESDTRRALVTQTWDFAVDYDWPTEDDKRFGTVHRIVLPKPPVQSVTSVKYIDTSGVEQTLATNQYLLRNGVIEPAYGVTWPSVREQMAAVTVRYVCGYGAASAVPEQIKQAILLLVGHWFSHREAVVSGTMSELPMAVQSLVFPFRSFY